MHQISTTLRATFLITAGSGGSLIALLQPWQEHLEWGARMLLLVLSIVSVIVGLIVAVRNKTN